MRSPVRSILALFAALALLLSITGVAGAARQATPAGLAAATEYMGVRGAHGGEAKPAKPGGGAVKNLQSGGGAVQTTPAIYISFWGSEWATASAPNATYTYAKAATYVTDFFTNVGGSAWNGVVTQYCQNVPRRTTDCAKVAAATYITNPSGQLKGVWSDTSAVPNSPTQTDIANAAKRLASHFGYNANATYMVFTPSHKSMSGFAGTGGNWCAWHSSTSVSGGKLAYAYIPYLPDAGYSCGQNFVYGGNNTYGNGWFDGFSVVAGHEYSEAETDPFPSSGWVDRSGQENADKCAWSSKSGGIHLGSHDYAVQPTWSNTIGGCPNV